MKYSVLEYIEDAPIGDRLFEVARCEFKTIPAYDQVVATLIKMEILKDTDNVSVNFVKYNDISHSYCIVDIVKEIALFYVFLIAS